MYLLPKIHSRRECSQQFMHSELMGRESCSFKYRQHQSQISEVKDLNTVLQLSSKPKFQADLFLAKGVFYLHQICKLILKKPQQAETSSLLAFNSYPGFQTQTEVEMRLTCLYCGSSKQGYHSLSVSILH
ncbi:hypothetical protein O6H91_18G025600 [Diphasiastrum complanatum]|uniref:Uncharacterized protein n=1 Tax=Diphasiastrum complanatum TaxID=34168 RepID=A0ACC2AZ90_DIPCM|nr:hypothetical protein O6H91_18G025600 [Diphasiastrum complanatum]